MPWPPTRVARDDQLRPVRLLERLHRRLALRRSSRAPSRCSASGKRSSSQLLHLAVAGEDDQRLVGGEEVVDPGERRAELAARGEPA